MPSQRSVSPVAASSPAAGAFAGGAELNRVWLMKNADAKNDSALMTNATFRPATAVTRPPTAAPTASIAAHVALATALAGISSSALVMFGIVDVRAGSKKACAETVSAITT